MKKPHSKSRIHTALLFCLALNALGGLPPTLAGSGHEVSATKADCNTLKNLLDDGVAARDIAKDPLVMQAMMSKCDLNSALGFNSDLKPSSKHPTDDEHHAAPNSYGGQNGTADHKVIIQQPNTDLTPKPPEQSKPENSHDAAHVHHH